MDAAGGGQLLRLAQGPVREGLDHLLGLVRGPDGLHGAGVEVEVLRVDDHVHVGDVAEFAQFQRRELHLGGTSPGEDVDVRDRVRLQDLVHVVRDLRGEQVLRVLGQHPGHVQRDVAGAEHGHGPRLERPRPRDVRVPVVPGDEVRGAVGLRQVDARDVECGVADRSRGEDHGVVELAELVQFEVHAEVHVAQQADVTALQHLVERHDDLLDPRVVRGDAVAHQPERRGKAFEEIDGHRKPGLGQDVCGVDAGRAGSDDRYA